MGDNARNANKLQATALGLGVALLVVLGEALLQLDADALDNPGEWIRGAILGAAAAIGGVLTGLKAAS